MHRRALVVLAVGSLLAGLFFGPSVTAATPHVVVADSTADATPAAIDRSSIGVAVADGLVDAAIVRRVNRGPTEAVVTFDRGAGADPASIDATRGVEITTGYNHVDAAIVTIDSSRASMRWSDSRVSRACTRSVTRGCR